MYKRYKYKNNRVIIFISFFLFIFGSIIFFESYGYKLIKHNFYYNSIEERLLSGIKTSKNSSYYNELYTLLKEENYTKFEKCLRFIDKYNCKNSKTKNKLFSNEDYISYFNIKYRNLLVGSESENNFKQNISLDNNYLLNTLESKAFADDKAKWIRENDVLNFKYYNDITPNYERIINPPIRKSKYIPNVDDNLIIDVLAFSDSFGEGAGNFDRDINWISILEKKLNSLDKPYKFRINQVSNIGANYKDYFNWSSNLYKNQDYRHDLFLLSFHNNDIHSFAEIENEKSIIPKATLRYINCINKNDYNKFLEKYFKNTIFIINLLNCESITKDGFLNLKNNTKDRDTKFIDYNDLLISYEGIINNLKDDIFLFDLDFITLNKEISYSNYFGDFDKSDFFRFLKNKGYLFVDNYKKINIVNNYLEKCKHSYCDPIEANYFDGHFSNVLLNALISSNIEVIYDKLVNSYSKKFNPYNKNESVKSNIGISEILLDDIIFKSNVINNNKLRVYYSDTISSTNIDTALCASLGREHVRIGLDRYHVINRDLLVKFNVFDDGLLFAIGGYDSFGNQVISDFLPIKDNNDFIFKGSEERRILFIAENSAGCSESKWSLPDLAFDIEFIS